VCVLVLIAIVSPWWQASYSSYRQTVYGVDFTDRQDVIFLWGYWTSLEGESVLLVFQWQLALVSSAMANFGFCLILMLASFVFFLWGNLKRLSSIVLVSSILLLLTLLIFYSQMSAVTNGKVVGTGLDIWPATPGSTYSGLAESNWGLSLGFYLTGVSSLLGFYNAYSIKRRQIANDTLETKIHNQKSPFSTLNNVSNIERM